MAPRLNPVESGSESDSDAPEAVSLSQSKKQIQELDTGRKNAEIARRESKRAQNRERDLKLKERAAKNKETTATALPAKRSSAKGKEKADEADDELMTRMVRAMAEVQQESGEDESDDDQALEDFEGISYGSNEDDEDSDSGSEEGDSEDDEEQIADDNGDGEEEQENLAPPRIQKAKFNPDHLPEELFAAAFAPKSKRKTVAETDTGTDLSQPLHKKRKANAPKDIVVGSRAIRILPNSTQPSIPSTLPSTKVEKFLDRTLALKGGKQPNKNWERRPANIGVLRRNGPALKFVRSS